ncbi:MAG: hypothetical protein AAFQ82_18810, partial [Myxococcota bacterium]
MNDRSRLLLSCLACVAGFACATSSKGRSEAPEDPLEASIELLSRDAFKSVGELFPPKVSEWLMEYESAALDENGLREIELATDEEELNPAAALAILTTVLAHEQHRTDGSSPGFESLLYGYIAALAELAKTEFMAEFVAGSEELSDEAKRSIRQLFDQAGEIATRAKANQRAAQAKLLREAPSHEHLTLAAYSVAEVG